MLEGKETNLNLKEVPYGIVESAGINRHRAGDERALRERRSCSITAPSHARAIVRSHVMSDPKVVAFQTPLISIGPGVGV